MPRNPDSSRFGKLFQVFFEEEGGHPTVTGCKLVPYLLEKGRVSTQSHNERNYHVFYGLLAHTESVSKFGLGEVKDYFYLNRFKYSGKPGEKDSLRLEAGPPDQPRDDLEKFVELLQKFKDVNFADEKVDEVISIVAGILLLGNIEITGDDDTSDIKDESQLQLAADVFRVDAADLKQAITKETVPMGSRDPVVKNKGKRKAELLRDALAKTVYDDMFVNCVVDGISESIKDEADTEGKFIGILDIFGFEFTSESDMAPTATGGLTNSLEQFCINLCNEQLQNFFVECVFKTENKTYKEELGFVPDLKFTKNDTTLKVLSTGRSSVVSLLTDFSTQGGDDRDKKLCESICKNLTDQKDDDGKAIVEKPGKIPKSLRQFKEFFFDVNHYAGPVLYSTNLWMEKNQNKLTLDGATCFSKSGHECWLSGFYKSKLADDEKGARTITEAFKNSLSELMGVLSTCNGNFVRCIKPREKLENSKLGYQGFYVLNQLKYV